jgi:class 3 adenylate cyclase/DNA-binding CsgD family transcriptional regulator
LPEAGTTTATILFTDVVGSTEVRARIGDAAADRLFVEHQRELGTVIAHHGGRVVKAAGDLVIASFVSASAAVRAAIGLQEQVSRTEPKLAVRVGVAAGDVAWEGDDCFGLPVVIASRLQAAADGGQIIVSHIVRLLAGDRAGDRYEPLGALALKGVAGPVEAFAVQWDRAEAPGAETGRPARPPLPLALAVAAPHAFVGREDALSAVRRAWHDAQLGPGRVVLIGGEAGAGKTRLASEFAREAHDEAAFVLYGGCDDDLALPYQPWVQAADQLLTAVPRASLSGALTARLAPLAQLLSRIDWLSTRAPAVIVDPDAERYRTYGAFGALLDELAERGRGLVVLDDLHWAGPQTLALLRYLARAGLPRGILVIGTFRDTGDEVSEPLAGCLADLRRLDVTRLRLTGLDAAAVERLVAAAVDRELDDGLRRLAAELADRSGGNAFFLAELWRHVVGIAEVAGAGDLWAEKAGRSVVPDSVRDVVGARLTRLSDPARRIIDLAALSGQRVDMQVLELAARLHPDELEAGAGELVAAGLLATMAENTLVYRFEHIIVRETVEAGISGRRRARLHLDLAEAIETAYEADRRPVLAELARHFAAARPLGGHDKAIYYGRRAASQALRAAAYDEAAAHLDSVLRFGPPEVERAEVLLELGTVELRRASYEASREACEEAFRIATQHGATTLAADAAVGFEVAMHFPGLPGGRAAEMLTQALEMVGDDAPEVRARVLATLGRALVFAGRGQEGVSTAEAAVALARAVGDPQSLMVALEALTTATDEPHQWLSASRELADLAQRYGDPWAAAYAAASLLRAYIALGRLDEAAETLAHQRSVSAVGRFAMFQFMAHTYAAVLALAAADFAAAEREAEQAQARASADGAPYDAGVYGLQMYAIRRAQGRLAEVAPMMRAVAATADPPPLWRPGLAAVYADIGMVDEARSVFATLVPDRFAAVSRDSVWPASLTFLAETCLALGDTEQAVVLYDELTVFRGFNLMAGMTICFGPADRLLGGLAALLGRVDEAEEHLRVALDLAERSRSPLWTAEVEFDWAGVIAGRHPERARQLMERAIAAATKYGIARLSERALACPDAGVGDGDGDGDRAGLPDNLSGREAEVLRLVATGRSNREIADVLFISQNTVANHVRSILQKTGCANRTEASLYAVRRGLLDA